MEDEAKRKRDTRKWGGGGCKISAPTHLNSSKAESTLKKKKQNKKNLFQSFKYLSKSNFSIQKFSFPSFQFHILNAQILNSNLQFSKIQTSDFRIKILRLEILDFKFQISNENS